MIEPQYEDLDRYAAPPDNAPEPRRYTADQIAEYVKSCCYGEPNGYTVDEIRLILNHAINDIEDGDCGIDSII